MALMHRIKSDAGTDDQLVWKFPSEEIRIGSQLIVNQSQEAIFLKAVKHSTSLAQGRTRFRPQTSHCSPN